MLSPIECERRKRTLSWAEAAQEERLTENQTPLLLGEAATTLIPLKET
jgi:hypothetical protein